MVFFTVVLIVINNFVFSSYDMWGLGCLIWEVFNGPLQQQTSLKNIDRVRKEIN